MFPIRHHVAPRLDKPRQTSTNPDKHKHKHMCAHTHKASCSPQARQSTNPDKPQQTPTNLDKPRHKPRHVKICHIMSSWPPTWCLLFRLINATIDGEMWVKRTLSYFSTTTGLSSDSFQLVRNFSAIFFTILSNDDRYFKTMSYFTWLWVEKYKYFQVEQTSWTLFLVKIQPLKE